MTKRRSHGEGGLYPQGKNTFQLKYRVGNQRISVTFKGSRADATKKLRELLRSADTGEHVTPDKLTLARWVKDWLEIGAPGRKRQKVGARAIERYDQQLARLTHARRSAAAAITVNRH